jgi:hypothetical protein
MNKISRCYPASLTPIADAGTVLRLFAFLWAVAALFHVVGPSGASVQIVTHPTMLGFSHVVLAMCAIWLLIKPVHNLPLILVAVLGPITAWLEAPQLGNHWLVVAFVDLALLLSALVTLRDRNINRDELAEVFLPLARWCLILFYSFAAFAKLNTAFFDTSVSCGTYYFDETAGSWGFTTPLAVGAGGLAHLVPFVAAATELSIPILLITSRTRIFGVVLGLGFHSLIALDRFHLFIDFSAVLTALFILFLPARFATSSLSFLKGKGAQLLIPWTVAACLVLVAQWVGTGSVTEFVFFEGRLLIWYVFDATILFGLILWLIRHGGQGIERPFAVQRRGLIWLMMVPALLVLNGLLPYFELRTAYAFNMYSNVRMVDGKSNHLIVRSSLPLAGRQANLVKVVESSDPGLNLYASSNYLLPWDSFRAYLAKHPDVAVAYQRGDKGYVVERASDYPELVSAPSVLVRKFLALRAVDGSDPPRCQDVFLPAL